MSARRAGGTKRSSWFTFRRRLLLVRLLLRQSETREALIAAVQAELGEEGYPPAAEPALKHDLDALREEFGCAIRYDRTTRRYVLDDTGELALLDLPDASLEALAFLDASFPAGAALPEYAHVRAMLDQVLKLLPAARRKQRPQQSAVRLELGERPVGRIDAGVLSKVRRAVAQRQELQFDYLSTFDDGAPRRHRVAPYQVFFRPEGHGYLDATLLEVTPSRGETLRSAIDYRLDRIVPGSVVILPNKLGPERLAPPSYTLRYRLLPVVARRRDVAAFFPDTAIDYHDDGGATITARVTNLWQTRQVLLRYGTACVVLDPPELVALFKQTAEGLAGLYASRSGESDV
jgi:predicted DNA-binding transcriptional regulator YafY